MRARKYLAATAAAVAMLGLTGCGSSTDGCRPLEFVPGRAQAASSATSCVASYRFADVKYYYYACAQVRARLLGDVIAHSVGRPWETLEMRAIGGVEVPRAVAIKVVDGNTGGRCGEWIFAPARGLPQNQVGDIFRRVTVPEPAQESGSEA